MHTTLSRVLFPAALASFAAVMFVSVAAATAPGTNGRLVFTVQVGGHTQLDSVLPDGSGLRRLTHFADGSDALNASWSPDGKQIVFERDYAIPHAGVEIMNADGTGLRALTKYKLNYYEGEPSFSPNGRLIAFGRQVSFTASSNGPRDHDEIWVRDLSGKHARQISPKLLTGPQGNHVVEHPEFSPDGKWIVYIRRLGSKSALFVAGSGGANVRQITPFSLGVNDRLDWSPDGSEILFSSNNGSVSLYTVHPDGSGLKQLSIAPAGADDKACSWSPDGAQVMFVRATGDAGDVYVMNADGTNLTQVTHGVPAHGGSWGSGA